MLIGTGNPGLYTVRGRASCSAASSKWSPRLSLSPLPLSLPLSLPPSLTLRLQWTRRSGRPRLARLPLPGTTQIGLRTGFALISAPSRSALSEPARLHAAPHGSRESRRRGLRSLAQVTGSAATSRGHITTAALLCTMRWPGAGGVLGQAMSRQDANKAPATTSGIIPHPHFGEGVRDPSPAAGEA